MLCMVTLQHISSEDITTGHQLNSKGLHLEGMTAHIAVLMSHTLQNGCLSASHALRPA